MPEDIIPLKEGVLDGIMKVHDEKGNLFMLLSFKQGIKEGYSYIYDSKTGKAILQIPYSNNLVNGEKVFFDEKGNIFQVENYVNDIQEGKSYTLFPNGAVQVEKFYETGILKKTVIYDQKGNIIQDISSDM